MALTREKRLAKRQRRRDAARRWAIPVIGGITPVGLIVVNIAAFIVHHLAGFRLIITVCAFVSGILLGSWQALNFFRIARRRMPNGAAFQETNEELILMAGMAAVIIVAAIAAYFCWVGLSDEKSLPNGATFLGGAIAIALPIVQQLFFRRALRKAEDDQWRSATDRPPQAP